MSKEEVILILGIDDAGRGPVIGPMVLAGCLIDKNTEDEFKKSGVKDSKDLTPRRREHLVSMIKEKAITYGLEVVFPEEIDDKAQGNLNELEAKKIASVINKINDGSKKIKVVVDCPSVNITAWTDTLKSKIDNLSNLDIVCEHKADRNHIAVSAASILAKSKREEEMDKLRKKYGSAIGSGYSSDPYTIKFLQENANKLRDEGIFRQSWGTWKNLMAEKRQMKLEI
ncbi:ribonuclease HII [Candidatus Pacearchaeota archaeon CG10_big_fil_rev_8_21_14_0_10_32_14]|nr:MAG: ribonuclease HII [Candidatus Pacearchaeota archaeon CG10_big_fil_rev_8_21_14_0_10_32_14]